MIGRCLPFDTIDLYATPEIGLFLSPLNAHKEMLLPTAPCDLCSLVLCKRL